MNGFNTPQHEVADIFNRYGATFRKERKLQLTNHKVMNAIQSFRTAALGGHQDRCSTCKYDRFSYNSCRNRHCPKCQGMNQLKWVEKTAENLFPTNYFHLVFTIPNELNSICLMNKKPMYDALFKAASETIIMLSKQQKHLGATPGITAVLHTWGQNLMEHPHIHMIVTAGGMSVKDKRWVKSKKNFLLPVKVVSKVFRAKFLAKIKQLYQDKELQLEGSIKRLNDKKEFKKLLDIVYEKDWVVYAKKPFNNATHVFKYLGKYTHKIAISNHRIVTIENNEVTFKYKDYADNNTQKIMTIKANEFIRRFLLHTLPKGFCKIRHYGLAANRTKRNNLKIVRKLLNVVHSISLRAKETWQETLIRLTGFDVAVCPNCKTGEMKTIRIIESAYG
jgi:hypothetical protein